MLPEPAAAERPERAIRDRVRRLLVEEVGVEPPAPSTDLVESGLLDSLGLIDMLAALEREFDIVIDLEDVDLDCFRSVDTVALFVSEQRSADTAASAAPGKLVDFSGTGGSRVPP